MVDIIIPAYNAHDTIMNALFSILNQSIVKKIKVYIIDDCSKTTYNKEYSFFKNKLNIELIRVEKNSGPGYCRQLGIEKSNSKYIIFLDSDDVFFDCYAIENILNVIEKNNYDVVSSRMIEKNNDKIYTYSVGFDTLHSKIYRRKFIQEKNVFFPNKYNSEDLSFNNLILMSEPKIGYCDDIIYAYRRRENSLTTNKDYYLKNHIKYYSENLIWTIKTANENKVNNKKIGEIIVFSFAYLYYYFSNNMSDKTIDYIYDLYPFYEKYEKYLDKDEQYEQISFWLERMQKYQVDMSFKQFVSFCKKRYEKKVKSC